MLEPFKKESRARKGDYFFSICIPHYNRTSFLLEALKSYQIQTFQDFEICISDDFSTDGRSNEIIAFLEKSGMHYQYWRQPSNLRYDGNLRASISLAKGKYCILMGNDDCFSNGQILEYIFNQIQEYKANNIGVIITNYSDYRKPKLYRRIHKTGFLGSGTAAAIANFRNVSFVSGVIFETEKALENATEKWDGSEMYQMYLACRILAQGKGVLGIDRVCVKQGIFLEGEQVDSWDSKECEETRRIVERLLPLRFLGRLVTDGIAPFLKGTERNVCVLKVFFQIYLFTYPFWIVEYRRVYSWQYAAGICIGMRPRITLADVAASWYSHLLLRIVYVFVTFGALFFPHKIFKKNHEFFYKISKSTFRAKD